MSAVKEQQPPSEEVEQVLTNLEVPTTSQRCDHRGCDAQAFVRVIFMDGTDLVFCAHHYHTVESILATKSVRTEDYRSQIK